MKQGNKLVGALVMNALRKNPNELTTKQAYKNIKDKLQIFTKHQENQEIFN